MCLEECKQFLLSFSSKLILIFVCNVIYSSSIAEEIKEINLLCEVQGYAMNSGMGKVDFPKATVTTSIKTLKDVVFIKVEGPKPYIGFATSKNDEKFENINLTNSNKFHLITKHKTTQNEIIINRVSGLISVDLNEISDEIPTHISYSGVCQKLLTKKIF